MSTGSRRNASRQGRHAHPPGQERRGADRRHGHERADSDQIAHSEDPEPGRPRPGRQHERPEREQGAVHGLGIMVAGEQRAVAFVHPFEDDLIVPESVIGIEADYQGMNHEMGR